jgi:hypothetical protein
MSEEKLEKQVNTYAALAKENPNIDAASLMLNALSQKPNVVSTKMKRWAYLVSLGLPPCGLLFALKFYLFSDQEDATRVGNVCVVLTIISVAALFLIGKIMFSSSGTSLQQIQQITPQEIQNTFQ